ncbi:FAD binding domain-containing protein [Aspergillus novoparasiticus]|uniref:FAD binding domain-containing protein n=1 Tax=Aspergillus novoparasiticus TaxID=986946 RepID=A0A5N6EAA1_9EURO|nr:FAD binding domain-containing protein [Aspergillus novoparasiticus]
MASEIQTKFLVVGAGPAGLALASFLGQNGLDGLVIAKAASTSDTPRAHSFNPFAFECLRDLGIEEKALQQSVRGHSLQSMRWLRSMVGDEYGKVLGWSEHPSCVEHAYGLTPCEYAEFSQSELEPLLVHYASQHNFEVRFSTELVAIERLAEVSGHTQYVCTVHDLISHSTFNIRTGYVFGADGARSHIARSLNFSFTSKPSGGKACNNLLWMLAVNAVLIKTQPSQAVACTTSGAIPIGTLLGDHEVGDPHEVSQLQAEPTSLGESSAGLEPL